jgi:hypothetical protein
MRTVRGMNCTHPECEPWGTCQGLTEYERRNEYWFRQRHGIPDDDLGTDPIAYYEGVTETG